jgi:hypothetical protein
MELKVLSKHFLSTGLTLAALLLIGVTLIVSAGAKTASVPMPLGQSAFGLAQAGQSATGLHQHWKKKRNRRVGRESDQRA